MSKAQRVRTSWGTSVVMAALLFLALLALGGCGEAPPISAVEPTATLYPPPPTSIPPPPPGPTPAALDFPLPAPNHVEEVEPIDDQTCVNCHTNEEMLKALAEEEEKPEVESEGEG